MPFIPYQLGDDFLQWRDPPLALLLGTGHPASRATKGPQALTIGGQLAWRRQSTLPISRSFPGRFWVGVEQCGRALTRSIHKTRSRGPADYESSHVGDWAQPIQHAGVPEEPS